MLCPPRPAPAKVRPFGMRATIARLQVKQLLHGLRVRHPDLEPLANDVERRKHAPNLTGPLQESERRAPAPRIHGVGFGYCIRRRIRIPELGS